MPIAAPVVILPSSPTYHSDFRLIASQLHAALAHENSTYTSIEHIGSTAIPGLPAKPIIDIAIVIPTSDCFEKVKTGLNFGGPGCEGPSYVCIGDGGIRGRWSFKCRDTGDIGEGFRGHVYPRRAVYVVVEGGIPIRAWRDLVRVLSDDRNAELREKYGRVKMKLAEDGPSALGDYGGREMHTDAAASADTVLASDRLEVDEPNKAVLNPDAKTNEFEPMEYSMAKNEIIAEVLRVAGWTEGEIKEKEGLIRRWWEEEGWDEYVTPSSLLALDQTC